MIKMRILVFCTCLLVGTAAVCHERNDVLVSNAAIHVLYRGYDNPIQVSVPTVSHEAISIECDNASVKADAKQLLWYVMPTDSTADRLTLRVFRTTNGQKVLLKEQICAVVSPAEPTIVGLCKNTTSTSDKGYASNRSFMTTNLKGVARKLLLDRDTELVLDYPAQTMKAANLTIKSFSAKIMQRAYECVGNKFSEDALKAISQLKSGDKISVFDILATDETGREIQVAPCVITIR